VTPSPPAASETPNLPARRSARYKDAFVPRRFSNDPLLPFPPSTFLHGLVVPEVSTSSTSPAARVPTERYDAASETNASSQSPALIRSTPPSSLKRSSLSSSRPTVGLPLAVTLMTCLALGRWRHGHAPPADALPLPPPSFLNESITPPVPALVDNAASVR
jgi:hypothetical protein